jgi:hypothetical protein
MKLSNFYVDSSATISVFEIILSGKMQYDIGLLNDS